jgi:hypothetical protein
VPASSTIIEDIDAMRKAGLASLVFFYCDFREDQKKDLRGLLSSLLIQLCHQSDSYCDTLFKFYSEHAQGSRHPSDDALVGCLKDLLKLPGLAPVYIIVDALDECPNTSGDPPPREEVLNLIEELIKSVINTNKKNKRWKAEDKQLVIDFLTAKADGMYVVDSKFLTTR